MTTGATIGHEASHYLPEEEVGSDRVRRVGTTKLFKTSEIMDLPFWEFASEVMQEYMAEEPDDFYPLTEMHKEWNQQDS